MKVKMNLKMKPEIKEVVKKVKDAQAQLQGLLKDAGWVDDARKYAERQGKEVKKLLTADMKKVKVFIEKEKKELAKFQKSLPNEVVKLKKFVTLQKKEFEKMLGKLSGKKVAKKATSGGTKKKATGTKKKATSANTASA